MLTVSVSFEKQTGHSGGSPRADAASTTSAAQSRWNVCLQAATAQSDAEAICSLQHAHRSKKPAAFAFSAAAAVAAGPWTTRYGWSSAWRIRARSSKMCA